MSYYIYYILAVGCFIGELFTMEFSLTCLGIGAIGAGIASWLDLNAWWQAGVFAVVASVCWIGVRPLLLKHLDKFTKHVNTPAEDVIGQEAIVEIDINPANQTGRVKVLGESWKATAAGPLAVGTKCVVEKLDGVTLTVRAK